ncbi:uncharacterized protein N7479_009112 [Penicillium vulpinum]|uniref:uncharacterized protein n=1 Tax=Penicillium vulpinum TaxID=29845 RepID=UPI002549118E|nr:uncharacterized protein N7479_009112 [Penicillium vulpinum]KAJ5950699.1 hypothetical protein N7479_009112 [Penicillium vulpinum]
MKSRVLNQTDVSQYFARNTFGIRYSYYTDDIRTRFSNSLRREENKRRKRAHSDSEDIAPEDQELYSFNSLGYNSQAIQRARGRTRSPSIPIFLPTIPEIINLDPPIAAIPSTPPRYRSRASSSSIKHRPVTRSTRTTTLSLQQEKIEETRRKIQELQEQLRDQENELVL